MDAAGSEDVELFGTLRLVRGGKHGYVGVRGGQGKKQNKFQAYTSVDSKKVTVAGLYDSAHAAAIALAQWKLQRELNLDEEPAYKKPRKRRVPLQVLAGAGAMGWPAWPAPPAVPAMPTRAAAPLLPMAAAVALSPEMSATLAAMGVPVAVARLA